MYSKSIALAAAAFAVLWSTLDVRLHNHFGCENIAAKAKEALMARTHLKAYMDDLTDYSGQPEVGAVQCVCDELAGKVVLTGRVDDENIRKEFSDVAILLVNGPNRVDNQIEVLNRDGLRKLQDLLASPPTNMAMNYQIRDRGTVYLTGDLPDPSLKEKVGNMVANMGGVRSVVNDLGKQLQVQRVLTVHNIYFDFNQWLIRPQSEPRLDEVAQKLTEYFGERPSGKVRVEGHTDSIATPKYNDWLSDKRAKAVLEALVARGIPRERLSAVGKGESDLLVTPDDTPEKRAENRRIEFHFE